MRAVDVKPVHLAVAAGVVVLAYVWLRGAKGAATSAASGVVGAAGGLVEGLGLGLGLPLTNDAKCAKAQASGDLFGASLYCTAPGFFGGLGSTAANAGREGIFSVGEALGIPRTDGGRCEAAKQAGDTLGASRYCGAGDFLKWWWEK